MYEFMIPVLATATRIACLQLAGEQITAMQAAVEQTASLPRKPGWNHKAGAHAQVLGLLAGVVTDPAVARLLRAGSELIRDLAIAAGPAADDIITNSHRRLLAHVRAADADAASRELERQLQTLHFMWRLTGRPSLQSRLGLTWANSSADSSATAPSCTRPQGIWRSTPVQRRPGVHEGTGRCTSGSPWLPVWLPRANSLVRAEKSDDPLHSSQRVNSVHVIPP